MKRDMVENQDGTIEMIGTKGVVEYEWGRDEAAIQAERSTVEDVGTHEWRVYQEKSWPADYWPASPKPPTKFRRSC